MLKSSRPLRVAVLSSHRCPGTAELVAEPSRGRRWDLVCAFTSEEDFATADAEWFASAGAPLLSLPIRPFHRARGRRISDFAFRSSYDREVASLLAPFRPDLLLMSSYLYVATPALLNVTRRRVVNVHGSDLTRRGLDGKPKYLGLRAVTDAILAGERETRATAHWVTEEVDLGPPILRSRAFPVPPLVRTLIAKGNERAARAYAFAHQEWMLQEAWGPLSALVIRLVAAGRAAPFETRRRPPGSVTAAAASRVRLSAEAGAAEGAAL